MGESQESHLTAALKKKKKNIPTLEVIFYNAHSYSSTQPSLLCEFLNSIHKRHWLHRRDYNSFDQYKWLSDHSSGVVISGVSINVLLRWKRGACHQQVNRVLPFVFNISATEAAKPCAEAKKANDTAVLLLQCFVFCMVMYYLFTGYFCWISGLISPLIHLTCEYMASLFVSVTDHHGSREQEHLGLGMWGVGCVGGD